MPNQIMCPLKVHFTHIDHIEKSMRTFLWSGKEIDKKGKCLVKWDKVSRPKEAGGLGVLDLRKQNEPLIMKNLFKFFNSHDIPWVQLLWNAHYQNGKIPIKQQQKGSFWWRNCVSFLDDFKRLTTCVVGEGNSILFWHDKWKGEPLASQFPEQYSFSQKSMIKVKEIKNREQDGIHSVFQLPLTLVTSEQYHIVQNLVSSMDNAGQMDKWLFPWNNVKYSTKKVSDALSQFIAAPPPF